jgi:DNA recombination protein RmuC
MTIAMLLIGLLLGLLLGAATAWTMLQRRATAARIDAEAAVASRVAQARTEAETSMRQLLGAQHSAALAQVQAQEVAARSEVHADLAAALAAVDELRANLDTIREQHREYVVQHRHEQAQRELAETGQTQVLKTLSPVAEQLAQMRRRVEEMERQRSQQHGQLAEQILHTKASVEESRKAADSLAAALSNNAVRGVWGETQLRTLVESAGLLSHVDFDTQRSITADSGARRPDMVINLPGGKQMAVDAKVPYNAFIEAHRTGIEPADRDRLLADHARKVRGHVDTLAGKAYWTGLDASPEFTVAYIPNDQLLAAAIDADASLMDYAFGRNVVLATPTNLWSILKTVSFTWKQDVLTEDAKKLFDLGRELYRRIVTLADHAEKMRRSLESTVTNYNKFASSLETRVLVTARRLEQVDEAAVIGTPRQIEVQPRPLTSDDFSALGDDLDRPELDLELAYGSDDEVVDGEIVDDQVG